ncbi:MAG: hypothetical protein K6E42_08015 [Synergistes sp.]|nr:hypothetical protein [Synergistes sp.]
MMIEGTVEVTGTVKVDNTASIENYLKMARNALEASNYVEAESYANKIIELNPQNSPAWEIKGEAAGWQSKANNNRMGESVSAWLNAIKFSESDDLYDLRERIATGYTSLLLAIIKLRTDNFGSIQSKENLKSTSDDLKDGIAMMNSLMVKGGVSFNRGPIYMQIARMMNSCACDGYKDAKKDFGPEKDNMAKWRWENYTEACDNCVKMLENALEYCRDNNLGETICSNLVTISTDVRDSCSWKYEYNPYGSSYHREYSFTEEAKAERTKRITDYSDKKYFYSKDPASTILTQLQYNRNGEEIERAKKVYWEKHASEKLQLEDEKKSLTDAISGKEHELNNLPISAAILSTTKKINDLTKEKQSLGVFKGKEKKVLQDKIDTLEQTKKQQHEQELEEKKSILEEVSTYKSRIACIESELSKSRGHVSVSSDDILIPGAIANGKFYITAQQLADHLVRVLPPSFEYQGFSDSSSGYSDFGNQIEIKFTDAATGEQKKPIGVLLYCTADNIDSEIRNIIIESGAAIDADDKSIRNWTILCSYVLMSLFKNLEQSEAEKSVLDIRFTGDRTLWVRDDIRFELATCNVNLFGLVSINKDALIIRPSL